MNDSLPQTGDEIRWDRYDDVVRALDDFFDESGARATAHGPQYVELWRALRRSTVGGKLFRPRMVAAVFDGLNGDAEYAVAPVGAAFELLHTALIVHDDVIDRDFVRRGRPNISGIYRDRARSAGVERDEAEHRGLSAAVVAGDLALFYSYRFIDRSGIDGAMRAHLLDLMDEALFASAAGELLDLDYSGAIAIPTVANILAMGRLKTAVYSFEVPLKAGAVLAQAPDAVVASMGDFGREVGTAYQIVDDILGVFGDTEVTGKSATSDLREGKRTVLVAHAAATEAWAHIAPTFGSPQLSDDEAATLRSRLEESGARAYAERLLADHVSRARAVLARDHIPEPLRRTLEPLIDQVIRRGR